MNRTKWDKTLNELDDMINFRSYARAETRLTQLHKSLLEEDHSLTNEDHYTVLFKLAGCYIDLGTFMSNRSLLDKGNAIMEKHKNDFPHLLQPDNKPLSQNSTIMLKTCKDNYDLRNLPYNIIGVCLFILFIYFLIIIF